MEEVEEKFDLDKEGRFVIIVPAEYAGRKVIVDNRLMNYMDYVLVEVEKFRNNPDVITLALIEYGGERRIRIVDLDAL